MSDIEFIERKMLKCKTEKGFQQWKRILSKLNALEELKSHITVISTNPQAEVKSDGSILFTQRYCVDINKQMDIECKNKVVEWIVTNIPKSDMDRAYELWTHTHNRNY